MREMSSFDPNQIVRYTFDKENCATRVSLVGLDNVNVSIDTDKLAESIGNAVAAKLELVKSTDKQEHDVRPTVEAMAPVFNVPEPKVIIQKEIERIEVPVIVEKTIVQIIEKPVIVEHSRVELVEKPVFVKEFVEIKQDLPKWVMIVMGIQSLFIVGLMIIK